MPPERIFGRSDPTRYTRVRSPLSPPTRRLRWYPYATRLDDHPLETSKTARLKPIMNPTPAANGLPRWAHSSRSASTDLHTAGLEAGLRWPLENRCRPTRRHLVPFDATASPPFADRAVDYDPSPTAGEQQRGTLLGAESSSSVVKTIAHTGLRTTESALRTTSPRRLRAARGRSTHAPERRKPPPAVDVFSHPIERDTGLSESTGRLQIVEEKAHDFSRGWMSSSPVDGRRTDEQSRDPDGLEVEFERRISKSGLLWPSPLFSSDADSRRLYAVGSRRKSR